MLQLWILDLVVHLPLVAGHDRSTLSIKVNKPLVLVLSYHLALIFDVVDDEVVVFKEPKLIGRRRWGRWFKFLWWRLNHFKFFPFFLRVMQVLYRVYRFWLYQFWLRTYFGEIFVQICVTFRVPQCSQAIQKALAGEQTKVLVQTPDSVVLCCGVLRL